ncbi:hypothetical protein DYB32_005974 [Aphanomyces invadans]|uniref:Calpain catalytic domain-containing protein n=1 Tax=Aphanomyces invadans TaxID=157072 RepID=A0A418ASV1_9STRA|nr:hypothetical protein DYB32_005974 [Aphanomyces invadans]
MLTKCRPQQYLPPLPEPAKPAASVAAVKTPGGGTKKGNLAPGKKNEPVDVKAEEPKKFEGSHPGFAPPLHAERFEWANDFQRVWSAEQAHDIKRWEAEEARIQSEKEKKELALMTYEESCLVKLQKAIAAHKQATEAELNDEDLLDDGDDGDETFDFPTTGEPAPMLFTDIFGSAPVIEIEPNPVVKPTIPEGDYVDAPLASGCRVVSRLVDRLVANQPFFWEAIYPQTVTATNRRIPTVNPGGKYLVKLFVMGKWRKIEVDDRMPLDEHGKVVILSSSVASEIWPTLLAKAIYKVFAWTSTLPSMNQPATVPQSVGFILNTLTGWKSRSIKTRVFNSSCGEAFVMSSIRPSQPGQLFSMNIFTLHPHMAPHETLHFTSDSIEYHKLTTVVLHTLPMYTHQLVEEWCVDPKRLLKWQRLTSSSRSIDDDPTDNRSIHRPYPHALPKCLTVHVPETVTSTTLYVTLTCAPIDVDAASPTTPLPPSGDRGMMFVEKKQLSWPTPSLSTINQNAGVLKANVTWPFEVVGPGVHVYRLYPHDLANGYSLEVESDVPIHVHPIDSCLKEVCKMNVELLDGSYNAMAHGTWHVVHRFNMTLTAPDARPDQNRLYLGFHMFDANATPYFHVHLVNNTSSESTRLSLLGGYFDLTSVHPSESYTVVLECLPCPNVVIPPNKFHITVASDWVIHTPLTQIPVVPSIFAGSYTPNKSLTLFRDQYVPEVGEDEGKASSKSSGVSAAPQLSMAAIHTCFKLSTSFQNAAIKLEVVDAATGSVLFKSTGYNCTQIMQLPMCSDHGSGPSGYIVQGTFDETKWVVPDSLRSVHPYNGLISKPRDATPDMYTPGTSFPPTPAVSTSTREEGYPSDTTWRLEVFGMVPAKLTPDCTALNKYAAIKHSWEVAERGREVRGVVSRLLFVGKRQEAIDRMVAAEYTPEQQKEMLARYDFLFGDGCAPITEVGGSEPEVLLGSDFFAAETQKLAQDLEDIKAHMEQAAKDRAAEAAARKLEMEHIKAEMAELRQAMVLEREKLWTKREEIRKQQTNPTPPSLFP